MPLAPPELKVIKNPENFKPLFPQKNPESPAPFFRKILNSKDFESTIEAINSIVKIKGFDPFFARYLMKYHKLAPITNDCFLYFSAPVVMNASSTAEIQELVKIFARQRGLEKQYFLTIMYLALEEYEKASKTIRTYFNGLGRREDGIRESESIVKALEFTAKVNIGNVTWTKQLINVSELHDFWMTWALRLSLPDNYAFPVSSIFFKKAFHYGRMFAGDSKIGPVKKTPEARKNLVSMFPWLVSKPWMYYEPELQNDIMSFMTTLRTMPTWFGGTEAVDRIIPPLNKRIFELVKLKRYAAAATLISKFERKIDTSNLEFARGKALFEEENWDESRKHIKNSLDAGKVDAVEYYTYLTLLSSSVEAEPGTDAGELASRLRFFLDYQDRVGLLKTLKSIRIKKPSGMLEYYMSLANLALNNREYFKVLLKIADGSGPLKHRAAIRAGEILLAAGAPWDEIYQAVKGTLYSDLSASAWGILAVKASIEKSSEAKMFLEKAVSVSYRNPADALRFVGILVKFGQWTTQAWNLSTYLRIFYQDSSELAWLRSVMLQRSSMYHAAWFEISSALKKRPSMPKYLKTSERIRKELDKSYY
ncbi:hypothetical protein KKF34_00690 [Myxococcota bacterium]|nr:hypothetical protein [Myxococcota bacterium]MBU1382086.1 hypothetical protein [Myxococcota bacterium]MBU1495378.1 hypothetical protein [Myxococcota bacterium]